MILRNYAALMLLAAAAAIPGCFINSSIVLLAYITIIVLGISLWLMNETTSFFDIRRATITSIWYFTYVFTIFIGCFMVFFTKPDPYRATYMFSVQSVLLTVPIGFYIANLLFKFDRSEIIDYYSVSVEDDDPGPHRFIAIVLILLIVIPITVSYFSRLETIPLLHMIKNPNQVTELTIMREESFKMLDPRWSSPSGTRMFYVYLFLRTTIYPFLIILTLGYFLVKRKLKWLALFLATLLCGMFYAGASIARAPVAAIFMRIACFAYIFKRGILGRKNMIVLLGMVLSFPIVITTLAYGKASSLIVLILRLLKRLFYSPAFGLYFYFEVFPEHHGFLHGQTLLKPFLQFFTRDFFYVENYVYKYVFPNNVVTGHENDAFISNLYADFGIAGVLVGGILVGVLMQGVQIRLLRSKKTVTNIAIFAFMIYAFWVLCYGSVTSVLFVNGVIPVIFLVWGIKFFEKILGPKQRSIGAVKDE